MGEVSPFAWKFIQWLLIFFKYSKLSNVARLYYKNSLGSLPVQISQISILKLMVLAYIQLNVTLN